MLDSVKYSKIIDKLVLNPCLRCGDTRRQFSIVGETNICLGDYLFNLGPQVPSVLVLCSHCGHIDYYAKKILDAREG